MAVWAIVAHLALVHTAVQAANAEPLRTRLSELQLPDPVSSRLPWGNVSGHSGIMLPLSGKKGVVRARSLLRAAVLPVDGAVREVGYFYATLGLGTPSRTFQLIIDTGSTITYIPCADCKHCGKHKNEAFDPKSSKTSLMLPCTTPKCNCGSPACQCLQNKCFYSRTYAERSSSEGFLLEDVFDFPDYPGSIPKGTKAPDVKVVFGCEQQETGEIYRQTADGILGMGNNNNAFQSQLVEQKIIDNTFALCFGYPDGGTMLLGDVPFAGRDKMIYTPLVAGWQAHYYTVKLDRITIDGKNVAVASSVYAMGYGAVLDSGTTFSYLPTAAFNSFADLISKAVEPKGLVKRPGADPQYNDICWKNAPEDVKKLDTVFPVIDMVFGNNAVLKLKPLQYLFVLGGGSYCLGVFDNGGAGTLLGGITVRNILLQYDRRNQRAGFLPVDDCDNIQLETAAKPDPVPAASSPPPPKQTPAPDPTSKPDTKQPAASPPPPTKQPAANPTPAKVDASPPPDTSAKASPPPPKTSKEAPGSSKGTTQGQLNTTSPPGHHKRSAPTGIIIGVTPKESSITTTMVIVGLLALGVFGGIIGFINRRAISQWVTSVSSRTMDAQDAQELMRLNPGASELAASSAKV